MVDTDDDPTLVKFMLNKAVTSMARRLVKTLKGTGFRKVQILLEDGSPVEVAADEEAAEQADTSAPDAPQPDAAALVAALTALVPRIADIADPARKEALSKQAREAKVDYKDRQPRLRRCGDRSTSPRAGCRFGHGRCRCAAGSV